MENPGIYENLLQDAGDASTGEIIAFLKDELPWLWSDNYRATVILSGTFASCK